MLLSGKEFNRLYKDRTFVKTTNKDENHYGFKYKTGLNIDTTLFDPNIEHGAGLYFTDIEYLYNWVDIYSICGYPVWMRYVTIPEDAKVFVNDKDIKSWGHVQRVTSGCPCQCQSK